MKKRTRIILICSIAVLVLIIIFFPRIRSWFSKNEESEAVPVAARNTPLSVSAKIVRTDTLTDIFRTKGVLIPDEEVDLTFETSGKITRIYFTEGSSVKKGDLLAKVNDETFLAELKKLEAQIPLAEERVFRQKSLYERDAVSRESYETVATQLETLLADIELVKARIRQTELRAPFDGIVGLRLVSEGAYASPTTVISKLTKTTPLKIEFSVNEKQIGEIRQGTKLRFSIDNDLNTYEAGVYAVESKLDENTLSLRVRARYPNPGGILTPGQSVTIEIQLHEITDAIVIPSIASLAEMGRSIAYVYDNGKARQVTLQRGMRTASSVQVLEGLNIGDTLLVSGVMQLRDGMPVNIGFLEE